MGVALLTVPLLRISLLRRRIGVVFPSQFAQKAADSTFLLLAGRELLAVVALGLGLPWARVSAALVVGVASTAVGGTAGAGGTGIDFGVEAAGVGFVVFVALLGFAVGVVAAKIAVLFGRVLVRTDNSRIGIETSLRRAIG